jgi:DNA-binding NtrC family response regulator
MKQNVNDLPSRGGRPPRIVVVDDETVVLQSVEFVVRSVFPAVTLLLFLDSKEAWLELSERNPDLLITDDGMPTLRGKEIVQRLADKKATFPIIVNSPMETTEEWVRAFASRGMNISFMALPFDAKDYQKLLLSVLPPATH